MSAPPNKAVIRGVCYFLAHTPGLVRHGSKPAREISKNPQLLSVIQSHLHTYGEAATYPPHRAFLGALYPDTLRQLPRPWFGAAGKVTRWMPHGEMMPEEEFYGLLKICDAFNLVWLEEGFARQVRSALASHPLLEATDLQRLREARPFSFIEAQVADTARVLPLHLRNDQLVGCVTAAHDEDASLTAGVVLENLACKATASMALRTLLSHGSVEPDGIEYVLNSGEEAVGERYQRGGGNLAKAVAEMCGCLQATGSDLKAFCCGPVHALVLATAQVQSGLFRNVAVVAGCSLAKLGMKFQGHLEHHMPILEDVLAGVAVLVGEDDNRSPILRLDSVGRHTVGAGSSQQAILESLVSTPLKQAGLRFREIDKYATELHNPEITEPAASGDVALQNYRLIGALTALSGEIHRADIPNFVETHGIPGFSPTQGHIASAIPFLGHAVDRMVQGQMERAMFLAKGSLFLGRMTQLSDGLSFILERNR